MFERIPEPELMQDLQQCMQYNLMHKFEPEIITVWLQTYHNTVNITQGTVIDLGTGTANLIIALLNLYPDLTAVCYEASEMMCEIARYNVLSHGLQDRCTVIHDDLYAATGTYDLAMSTRALHHVRDTASFWELIAALSPTFLVCDLERPYSEDLIPNDPDIDFQNSLRASYTVSEIREQTNLLDCEILRTQFESEIYGIAVYRTA